MAQSHIPQWEELVAEGRYKEAEPLFEAFLDAGVTQTEAEARLSMLSLQLEAQRQIGDRFEGVLRGASQGASALNKGEDEALRRIDIGTIKNELRKFKP